MGDDRSYIVELVDGVGLDVEVIALELLPDLFQRDADELGLIFLVGAQTSDEVRERPLEHGGGGGDSGRAAWVRLVAAERAQSLSVHGGR